MFAGLESGPCSGVWGGEGGEEVGSVLVPLCGGWSGIVKGAGGQRGPLGQELSEGKSRTGRRWCLSQEAECPIAPPAPCRNSAQAQTLGEQILGEGEQEGAITLCQELC